MKESNLYLGLDVHAESIATAVVAEEGTERNLGSIANSRKLLKKARPLERLQAVYEAGPTGYALYWEYTAAVIAFQSSAASTHCLSNF